MADSKRALEAARPRLTHDDIGSATYWTTPARSPAPAVPAAAFLLPVYDEYLIAYKDRSAAADSRTASYDRSRRDDFGNYLIIRGRFAGAWRWKFRRRDIAIRLIPYRALSKVDLQMIRRAATRLSEFAGMPVTPAE